MHGVDAIEPAPAKPRDASNPDDIAAARRLVRMDEREIMGTIHEMMTQREVRAVVYRWLETCGAFRGNDFPMGERIDPLQLARNAAHREVAQFISADLFRSAPESYLVMLRENQDGKPTE